MTAYATCAYSGCMEKLPYELEDCERPRYCPEHQEVMYNRFADRARVPNKDTTLSTSGWSAMLTNFERHLNFVGDPHLVTKELMIAISLYPDPPASGIYNTKILHEVIMQNPEVFPTLFSQFPATVKQRCSFILTNLLGWERVAGGRYGKKYRKPETFPIDSSCGIRKEKPCAFQQ